MTGRRSLLVVVVVVLSVLFMAACTVAGALLESATLTRKLGDHGYTNANVHVGFNSSNGIRTDSLTVTVDRPASPPSDDAAATELATFVVDAYGRIGEVEVLVIALRSQSSERTFSRSPQEWRDHLFALQQPPSIEHAVTARSTFGEEYEPRDVTTNFAADQAVFHAVVSIRNLPAGSVVKAVWVAVDTHGDSRPNFILTSTVARVEGTRNVDFALAPTLGRLPRGSYKVDIHLGDRLDRSLPFTVDGG